MPRNVTRSKWDDTEYELYLPFTRVAHLIIRVGFPCVLLFGIFGNFMIILIMHRLLQSSVGILFQVLACSDQIFLLMEPLTLWLEEELDVPRIEDLASWPCKLFYFLRDITMVLCPWTLVALTMQRAASVLWPHRINAVWTKARSRAVAGSLIVVTALTNAHILYGYDLDLERSGCGEITSETYTWFFGRVWSWVELITRSALPFVLLVVSNGVLLRKLVGAVNTGSRLPLQPATQQSRQEKVTSLTLTLILVSAVFFLLTLPRTVYGINYTSVDLDDPVLAGQNEIFNAVSGLMLMANSGVNFYLYCLSGRKLRAQFWNLIM